MDLNLLRVFEVIYRERSLSRAAEILHLTPSAVSHALKRLRATFDDPLFLREGHRMVPTPWCAQIAHDILEEMSRLRAMLQRWDAFDPSANTVATTISMPDALEHLFLPELFHRLSAAAPQSRLVLTGHSRRNLVSDLRRRHTDLVIDVSPLAQDDLNGAVLLHSGWCLALRPDHPMANRLDAATFGAAQHLAVSSRAVGSVLEDSALMGLGVRRQIALRCQNYFSALETLRATDLLLTLPEELARRMPMAALGIKTLPHPLSLPEITLHMYWHADTETDGRARWLRDHVRRCLSGAQAELQQAHC